MIDRFRCPNCSQEFENATGDFLCPHCKTAAFLIEKRQETAATAGTEITDMEPSSADDAK